MKRVVQLTPTMDFGDAVSNDILAMHDVLTALGFDSQIYAYGISDKVRNRVRAVSSYIPRFDDVILYHMSIGSDLSQIVAQAKVKRKIMIYHNITPAMYFEGLDHIKKSCSNGRNELKMLSCMIDFAFADSDYNKEELDTLGYKKTKTLPIIFNTYDYLHTKPNSKVINKYNNDGYTNVLFVGRLAPNKKQEDIIKSFYLYNKYINNKSRLFLIGSSRSMENYFYSLKLLVDDLHVNNVIFPGHISFNEMLAYYSIADIFLCMSEHEGFCVPLLESMIFDVPIIAYASSAIPSTLSGSGILVTKKKYELIAETMHEVVLNIDLKTAIIDKQRLRLKDFEFEKTKALFAEAVSPLLLD